MKYETRVYLEKAYLPFEGYFWAAIFVNDPHGSRLGYYKTKKAAREDVKKYGLRLVTAPATN